MDTIRCESATNADESSSNADFSLLPPELQEQILKYLPLKERMQSRLVSRRWNDVALSSVQLNLRINGTEFNVDGGVIKSAFRLKKATPTRDPTVEHPEASLNDIWQLPPPLMERCFQIDLLLGSGCNMPVGLLSKIAAQISRTCKLNLSTVDLPLNVFTTSTQTDITFAEEFPGLQLQSLSLASELDGSSTGNNELLNYFRTDHAIELAVRSPLSNSTMAIVPERYPQATELRLDLCSHTHGSDSIEPPTSADWLILTRFAKLRKLTILIDGETTMELPGLHLPHLIALGCQNVILSPEADFLAHLPQLERLELKRSGDENGASEVKIIASAIRTRQLKELAVAKFEYSKRLMNADNFECMQLLCKAILESGSTAFRRLCWYSILITNQPDRPGFVQLLNDLPEGCFRQRSLAVMVPHSEVWLFSNVGRNDVAALIVPTIIKAMIRSGLSQLTLGVCINDLTLLNAVIDVVHRAAMDLGLDIGLDIDPRAPENANTEDDFDLRASFTPPVLRPVSVVLRIEWEANGQEQKLELVSI